jgi:hypothetical protein
MSTVIYSTGPIENLVVNRSNTLVVKLRNGNPILAAEVRVTIFSVLGTITPVNSQFLILGPNSANAVNLPPFIPVPAEYEVVVEIFNFNPSILVAVYGVDIFGNLNPAHRVLHSEMQVIGFVP